MATLEEAGFTDLVATPQISDLGVSVDVRALDSRGRTWLFVVTGAYSSTRPGLRRPEVLWRTLGQASVIHAARMADPARTDLGPLVVLTTDLPPARSAAGKALGAVTGAGLPVRDVCLLVDSQATSRLRAWAQRTADPR